MVWLPAALALYDALHVISLLCVIEGSQSIYTVYMLDIVIYTICSNWEGPLCGEADVSQYPLF